MSVHQRRIHWAKSENLPIFLMEAKNYCRSRKRRICKRRARTTGSADDVTDAGKHFGAALPLGCYERKRHSYRHFRREFANWDGALSPALRQEWPRRAQSRCRRMDGNCTTGAGPFSDWWGWNWSQGRTSPEREKCNVEWASDCDRDYNVYGNLLCAAVGVATLPSAAGSVLAVGACTAELGYLKPYDCRTTCSRKCR